ncbi:hypothetical protein COOONC_03385 [Cooperia oncophora]
MTFDDYESTEDDVVTRLQAIIAEVRETKPGFNIFSLIGPDEEKIRFQHEYRTLDVGRQFAPNSDGSKEETLRTVAEQFQAKIQKLIAVHAKDRAVHEKV